MPDDKKGDIEERRESAMCFNFNMGSTVGYDGIIGKFNGTDKTLSASKWLQEIDDNGELFGWTPTQKLILARRGLTGTAELWSKAEKVFKSYDDFKAALSKEFPDISNVKEIHELMAARKKKKEESCYEYMLIMKELGRRGKFADYVAIQYIVDGIVDYEPNKTILYSVTTYPALKEKLAIYENMKKNMARKRYEPAQQTPITEKKISYKGEIAKARHCYKCGDKVHIASACRNGVKCYKCNQFGHIATACMNRAEPANKQHEVSNGDGDSEFRKARWHPRAMCLKLVRNAFENVHVGTTEEIERSDSMID